MRAIRIANNDEDNLFLQVGLDANHAELNIEETLNNYAKSQLDLLINPVNDAEFIRFAPSSALNILLAPEFFSGTAHENSYVSAGFNQASLYPQSPSMRNSVYKFEYYDSNETSKQRFIFSQVLRANEKGAYRLVTNTIGLVSNTVMRPAILISGVNASEFNNLYIPRSFLSKKIYLKISFFNSLTGKTIILQRSIRPDNESDLYVSITLTEDRKYLFTDLTNSIIPFYQSVDFSTIIEKENNKAPLKVKLDIQVDRGEFNPLVNDPDINFRL